MMNRRMLLSRISLLVAAAPVLIGCAAQEDDYPPRPPGGGGGGGNGDPEPDEDGAFLVENQDASGHAHSFELTCAQLEEGVATYTAGGAHSHQVTLTADQIADVLDGRQVVVETTGGHPHTWIVQMPSALCG